MYFVILTVCLFICIFDALLFGGNKESINQSNLAIKEVNVNKKIICKLLKELEYPVTHVKDP